MRPRTRRWTTGGHPLLCLLLFVFCFVFTFEDTCAFRVLPSGGSPAQRGPQALAFSRGGPPGLVTTTAGGPKQQESAAAAATAAAGAANSGALQRAKTSQLLKAQRQAAPSVGAEVSGEFVNGKSVKDWTVKRSIYQALHMALAEELERDPRVCIIAMHGLRPVVEGMNMGFLLLAFNQISNNAGMVRATSGGQFDVPLVIRGPGGVGKQLGPEHSQRIEAYLLAVPGLKLVACSTPRNARGLLKSAIREDNPVVFFEHVLTYGITEEIPLLPYTQPLDKAEIALEGEDVTILAYSKLRHVALEAAKTLEKLGIHPEVVDLISLKPLDIQTIKQSIKKTGKCLILDESSRTGGIGGEVFTQVVENCFEDLLLPPVRLATKDIPTPYARVLEEAAIITKEDVINSVLWMVSTGRKRAV
ncbi:hypothetical protein Efla_001441 [Eimeria flavescens]